MTKEILGRLQPLRMVWHVLAHTLVGVTYLIAQPTPREALACLLPFAVMLVVVDVARLFIPRWGAFCAEHYAGFMREHERHFLSAMTLTLVAMCMVVWLFDREVAASAILLAGLVDPSARLCGVLWGRIPIEHLKKTYVGLAGGVVAGMLLAWGLSAHMVHVAAKLTFTVLGCGALFASAIELFAGRLDNLLIPLGTAGAMTMLV